MDEMEMTTHESRRREPTGAHKGKKTQGERKGKELDVKRCCWSRTDESHRVSLLPGVLRPMPHWASGAMV
jgi:hypothetical protein